MHFEKTDILSYLDKNIMIKSKKKFVAALYNRSLRYDDWK